MKKNTAKKQPNSVTTVETPKRAIRNTKPEREHKIVAYLQAAKYNAAKLGNVKLGEAIDRVLKAA